MEKKEKKEKKECRKVIQYLFDELFEDMIGNNIQFTSPIINEKKEKMKKFLIYADFTASGKGLKRIERFIQEQVLPTYANVHSTVGHCAEITAKYLADAKEKLRTYTNADGNYSIIFHGQGATGGVHKLIEILSIKKYVKFYQDLENCFNIKNKYNENYLDDSLLNKIKYQFKELFIDINFCFREKENNKNVTKCILCKEKVESEGDYHQHIKGIEHQKFLRKYEENQGIGLFSIKDQQIIDFIDIIRRKYNINTKESIIELINDYKKFKPVIFYSLYEHNSNSLSWRETQCEIVLIEGDYSKFYDNLKDKLEQYKDNYIKIGSFTAASNITGLLLDVDKIAALMHDAYGYAFFDYAAGAPYLKIDVKNELKDDYREEYLGFDHLNEYDKKICFKDGVFFSPHKFIGGPNTPGVLITHDRIYRNQLKPTQPGGGTVSFVYKDDIDYIQDVELKEESGTPNIIGGIRLGLMISIMMNAFHRDLICKEEVFIKLFEDKLEKVPNIYILHDNILKDKPHIPIFSFMISFGNKFLHPNFVCALLNDLFGIQSRPGCSCAPNYGKFLLGFDKDKNFSLLQKLVSEGKDIFKPGYVRLNLPYFYPDYVIEYIIDSIKLICEFGHLLLGLYHYNIKSGKFYHYDSPNITYTLDSFNFVNNWPNDENLYNIKNNKKMTKDELNKILTDTKAYLLSNCFLKRTFYIENNEPKPRRKYEEFEEAEEARWFCVFKDVEPLLKRLNVVTFLNKKEENGTKDEEIEKLTEEFTKLETQRKNDWSINYQKVLSNSMIDI